MSFSSLYKFLLKLKGRGHFLSPKEVQFLKELLKEFPEEEIKKTFERCYKEVIPPSEREKSSLLRCKNLFEKLKKGKNFSKVYLAMEHQKPSSIGGILKQLPLEERKKIKLEIENFFKTHNLELNRENIEEVLKIILSKYL